MLVLKIAPSRIEIRASFGIAPLTSLLYNDRLLTTWLLVCRCRNGYRQSTLWAIVWSFRRQRSKIQRSSRFSRFGEKQVSDSAHDLFLGVIVNGGIPLCIIFILLNFLTSTFNVQANKVDLHSNERLGHFFVLVV